MALLLSSRIVLREQQILPTMSCYSLIGHGGLAKVLAHGMDPILLSARIRKTQTSCSAQTIVWPCPRRFEQFSMLFTRSLHLLLRAASLGGFLHQVRRKGAGRKCFFRSLLA